MMTITDTGATAAGVYNIDIGGVAPELTRNTSVKLTLKNRESPLLPNGSYSWTGFIGSEPKTAVAPSPKLHERRVISPSETSPKLATRPSVRTVNAAEGRGRTSKWTDPLMLRQQCAYSGSFACSTVAVHIVLFQA